VPTLTPTWPSRLRPRQPDGVPLSGSIDAAVALLGARRCVSADLAEDLLLALGCAAARGPTGPDAGCEIAATLAWVRGQDVVSTRLLVDRLLDLRNVT
jgi:hypothetical protein